jgi:hypothetical protein
VFSSDRWTIGGSRSEQTLPRTQRDRQPSDDELDPELFDPELFDSELLESELFELEPSDFVEDDEVSLDDEPLSELVELESLEPDDAVEVADFLPRLSVLKKPDPLKVTPTGVNTFLTGRTSPESGWAISVRFSS